MPKLIRFPFPKSIPQFCLIVLCFVSTFWADAIGQTANLSKVTVSLPDKLGESFRLVGKSKTLTADQSTVLPDAEMYKEFWLENLTTAHYSDGKRSFDVEIFQSRFDSGAFGLFTLNRGQDPDKRYCFFTGRYFVSLSSNTLGDISLDPITQSLKALLNSSNGELSPLPSHLPAENKIADTEKYLLGPAALAKVNGFANLKDVLNFSGGTEVATADYQNGSGKFGLMIVEYHTPQQATDGLALLQSHFDQLSEQERKQRILKRVGNYVVATTVVQDLASAEKLISQIKYTQVVYWEARKITDIPIAFRPPDPQAVADATETASIMIRTFYWIGVMLFGAIVLGVISGGAFFYWNRHRRRKLGLDDMFSDAGGTVRLNLDDHLLTQATKANDKENLKKL